MRKNLKIGNDSSDIVQRSPLRPLDRTRVTIRPLDVGEGTCFLCGVEFPLGQRFALLQPLVLEPRA